MWKSLRDIYGKTPDIRLESSSKDGEPGLLPQIAYPFRRKTPRIPYVSIHESHIESKYSYNYQNLKHFQVAQGFYPPGNDHISPFHPRYKTSFARRRFAWVCGETVPKTARLVPMVFLRSPMVSLKEVQLMRLINEVYIYICYPRGSVCRPLNSHSLLEKRP